MANHVNLKAIAHETGVSVKTVSRALNGHPDVGTETRRMILAVAQKVGYSPNLAARGLRTNRSYAVGYVVPDITSEFFGKVGIALERELRQHQYGLLMSFTEGSAEKEIESLWLLLAKRVDGIVLATVGTTGAFLRDSVVAMHVPLVVIDNKSEGVQADSVVHDNAHGANLLTTHLIEHGHRKVACITGPLSETSARDRYEGYKAALKEAGIEADERLVRESNWMAAGGCESASDLLRAERGAFTAVFVANTAMALGVYKAFRRQNVHIPQDVAVVSFDKTEFADALEPPLTTLESVEDEIATVTAELLLQRIQDKQTGQIHEQVVRSRLSVQRSCGCPEPGQP